MRKCGVVRLSHKSIYLEKNKIIVLKNILSSRLTYYKQIFLVNNHLHEYEDDLNLYIYSYNIYFKKIKNINKIKVKLP